MTSRHEYVLTVMNEEGPQLGMNDDDAEEAYYSNGRKHVF
jgi:hypothetical protein